MLILYGAVLLVMAALNLFLAFIIRQIIGITDRQVQMHFSRELGRCAESLDQKLQELSKAEERLSEVELRLKEQREALGRASRQTGAVPAARQESGSSSLFYQAGAAYRGDKTLEVYRYIKDQMDLDYEALIKAAAAQKEEPERDWELCGQILEKLKFELLYQLVTSSGEIREQILKEHLTEEELGALERIAPADGYPDPVKRIDCIRQYRMMHDPQVRVICGEKDLDQVRHGEILTEYDARIHEGIRLRMGTGVLDYSL